MNLRIFIKSEVTFSGLKSKKTQVEGKSKPSLSQFNRGFPPIAGGFEMSIPPQPAIRLNEGESTPSATELSDILSIQRLQMAYAQLHDHGTADEIAALFHPQAELYALYLLGRGFRGRSQIRDWYAWWLVAYMEDGEYYRHRPMNQVIDLYGDYAVSNSVLIAEGSPRNNDKWTIHLGRYVHELVRCNVGWAFLRSWIILYDSTAFAPRTRSPEGLWMQLR